MAKLNGLQSSDSDFILIKPYLTRCIHAIWKERRIRELNYLSSLLQPCGFSPPRSRELVPLVANLSQNINLPRLNASLLHWLVYLCFVFPVEGPSFQAARLLTVVLCCRSCWSRFGSLPKILDFGLPSFLVNRPSGLKLTKIFWMRRNLKSNG